MAVYTQVSAEALARFLAGYDHGELISAKGIAEGVENTNYRLVTDKGAYVLTLFEGRTDAASLPFCLGLTQHLAGRGFPTPAPVAARDGTVIGRLNGRAAAILEWAPGDWRRQPSDQEQYRAGQVLASLDPAGVAAGIAACLVITGAEKALVVLPTSFSGDVSGLEDALANRVGDVGERLPQGILTACADDVQ